MEAKFYIGLLIWGLIAAALAKGGHHRHHDGNHDNDNHHGRRRGDPDKCPPLKISDELKCKNVTNHCGTFACSKTLDEETVWLGLTFNRSQDPMIVEMSVTIPARKPAFNWSFTSKSGSWDIWSVDKIEVLKFPLTIEGFEGDDMFLTLMMDKTVPKGIDFQLNVSLSKGDREDLVMTLLQGNLPVKDYGNDGHEHRKSRCSRFVSWFKRQPVTVKTAIGICAILVLSLVITALVYCCKKRRATAVNTVKVRPPYYDETKVPMEPLINEE